MFLFSFRDGGIYANNIISETYNEGELITVSILLTASHKGYFEFRIGEYDNTVIKGDKEGKLIGTLLKQVNEFLIFIKKYLTI